MKTYPECERCGDTEDDATLTSPYCYECTMAVADPMEPEELAEMEAMGVEMEELD